MNENTGDKITDPAAPIGASVDSNVIIAEKANQVLNSAGEFFGQLAKQNDVHGEMADLEAKSQEQTKKIEELLIELEKSDKKQSETIKKFVQISKKVQETMGTAIIAFSYDPTNETLKRAVQNLTKMKSITQA